MKYTLCILFTLLAIALALQWNMNINGSCGRIGKGKCCNSSNLEPECTPNEGGCYCHHGCHTHKDVHCCEDACPPRTCRAKGLSLGRCGVPGRRFAREIQCYVPGGKCYCDPLCELNKDCCSDVIPSRGCPRTTPNKEQELEAAMRNNELKAKRNNEKRAMKTKRLNFAKLMRSVFQQLDDQ